MTVEGQSWSVESLRWCDSRYGPWRDELAALRDWVLFVRHMSPDTWEGIECTWRVFLRFIRAQSRGVFPGPMDIDQELFERFLIEKRKGGAGASTINKQIFAVRIFYKRIIEKDDLDFRIDPTRHVRSLRIRRQPPITFTPDELRRTIEAAAANTRGIVGLRDVAMIYTASLAGLRSRELRLLTLADVDMEARTITVTAEHSKNGIARAVPICDTLHAALTEWLRARAGTTKRHRPGDSKYTECKYVFPKESGAGPLAHGVSFGNRLSRALAAAGIKKPGASPHKLRHTFATKLHELDVDILEIKALLGHTSVKSTEIYTHTNPDMLKEAVNRLNLNGNAPLIPGSAEPLPISPVSRPLRPPKKRKAAPAESNSHRHPANGWDLLSQRTRP